MAHGIFRIKGNPNWVQVNYGTYSMPMSEDDYRQSDYEPPVEALPWQGEHRMRRNNNIVDQT